MLTSTTMPEALQELRALIGERERLGRALSVRDFSRRIGRDPTTMGRSENPDIRQTVSDASMERIVEEWPGLTTLEELQQIRRQTAPQFRRDKKRRGPAPASVPVTPAAVTTAAHTGALARPRFPGNRSAALADDTETAGAAHPGETHAGETGAGGVGGATIGAGAGAFAPRDAHRSEPLDLTRPYIPAVPAPPLPRERADTSSASATWVHADAGPAPQYPGASSAPGRTSADVRTPAAFGARRAAGPLLAHAPSIQLFAQNLREVAATSEAGGAHVATRFTMAAASVIGALEGLGAGDGTWEVRGAIMALLDDCWRLAHLSVAPVGEAYPNVPAQAEERSRLEALLQHIPERREAYQRLVPSVARLLLGEADAPEAVDAIRVALLRVFTAGARS